MAQKTCRPPLRISTRTDDEFEAARRHGLDEDAVEPQTGFRALNVIVQVFPRDADSIAIPKIEDDAPRFGLVSESASLSLEHDRKADPVCDLERLFHCLG